MTFEELKQQQSFDKLKKQVETDFLSYWSEELKWASCLFGVKIKNDSDLSVRVHRIRKKK